MEIVNDLHYYQPLNIDYSDNLHPFVESILPLSAPCIYLSVHEQLFRRKLFISIRLIITIVNSAV